MINSFFFYFHVVLWCCVSGYQQEDGSRGSKSPYPLSAQGNISFLSRNIRTFHVLFITSINPLPPYLPPSHTSCVLSTTPVSPLSSVSRISRMFHLLGIRPLFQSLSRLFYFLFSAPLPNFVSLPQLSAEII